VTVGSLADHIDTLQWLADKHASGMKSSADVEGGEV